MYLRETRRRNRDGSTVSYLQLAHNERHPVTGAPTAKVVHNFGRAETVDRAALSRLVASISRFLDPEQAVAATTAAGAGTGGAGAGVVEILDSRRLGGAWVLDRVWERLGIGAAIRRYYSCGSTVVRCGSGDLEASGGPLSSSPVVADLGA